jgi:predicted amidohydrolase YtcJ
MATKNTEPDLILMNGRIATQDERRSFAQAVAIQDGRFVSVGTNELIMALRGSTSAAGR